jgi:hypothetical protein
MFGIGDEPVNALFLEELLVHSPPSLVSGVAGPENVT